MTTTAGSRTSSSLATAPDGQWAVVRRGAEITLLAYGVGPAAGRVDIGSEDADVAFVGPPAMVIAVVRNVAPRVMLYQPPRLEIAARHDLDQPMRIAGISGPRVALLSRDHRRLVIVRVAATALAAQTIELDGPADFVVGLEKQQFLISIQRRLEVWDAATGRPTLRMQLQLPPPPRTVGAAQGHIWVTRPSADDVILYRLSDGRPFRHVVGAPTTEVASSTASPIAVVGTTRGLVRLHCFAHSLTPIDAAWKPGMPLAQLVAGDDITLLGLPDGADEPWRVRVAGAGAPAVPPPPDTEAPVAPESPAVRPSDPVIRFRRSGEIPPLDPATGASVPATPAPEPPPPPPPALESPPSPPARVRARTASTGNWRDNLNVLGAQIVNGATPDLNIPIDDSELAELADRLLLAKRSIRALMVLYAAYLVGEPALSVADLAQILDDWHEPLGTGELGALGMLRRRHGRVALRAAVADLLDGNPPRAVRLTAGAPVKPRPGAWRLSREGKSDAELEALLASKLGRIAIVEGKPRRALLEARLHGATAIAFHPPERRPHPWPRDAGLVLVLYGSPTSWIADLPTLE